MLSMALAFAVGQVTNVLLPGLVQLQRGGSSLDYSTVEIAWSLGSLAAGGVLALFRPSSTSGQRADVMVLAILGALAVLLATVPFAQEWTTLVVIHELLGIGYATARVLNDARFLALCAEERLGHNRATANMIIQIAALLAFSLPIVANQWSPLTLYRFAAALVGVATFGVGMRWFPMTHRMLE